MLVSGKDSAFQKVIQAEIWTLGECSALFIVPHIARLFPVFFVFQKYFVHSPFLAA